MNSENAVSITHKIESLIKILNNGLFERERVINLSLLSMIANEAVFFIGPPGVAKSLIARRLSLVINKGKVFEYLMHRFSTPDEIFGPVSIRKLKNEDKYERVIDGYLPDAEVVFLDEIWKAGPSIQNTLLTVINEKIYKNGDKEINIPLKCLIAASNEFPAKDQGLDALWDRFVLKLVVEEIKDDSLFLKMIKGNDKLINLNIPDDVKISSDDFSALSKLIDNVKITNEVTNAIIAIKYRVNEYNKNIAEHESKFFISDRKWKKIAKILKTSAVLNGRNSVNLLDTFLVADCIWNNLVQKDIVLEIVKNSIKDFSFRYSIDFSLLSEEIESLKNDVERITVNKIEKEIEVMKMYIHNDTEFFHFNKFPIRRSYTDYYYEFIKVQDFNNLDKNLIISLYQHDFAHEQFTVSKSNNKITVHLPSDKNLTRVIESEKQKYFEFVFETPTTVHVTEWDRVANNIMLNIDEELNKLKKYEEVNLKDLNNFFVDSSYIEIIKESLRSVNEGLLSLKTELKRLQKHYKGIKSGEVKDTNLPLYAVLDPNGE